MATFDGWEAQLYGPNTLAHFRTKGSKNGVRRYQNEDGTWTPLGLRERKAREGWGNSKETRASKARATANRMRQDLESDVKMRNNPDLPSYMHNKYDRVIKSETKKVLRAEKRAAREERIAAYKEEKRQSNVKTMTDAELRKRIERVQLEKEYRELSKSPARQLGEKLVSNYFDYRDKKEQRRAEKEARVYEMMKLKEQTKQAKLRKQEAEARSKADAARASADKAKAETDYLDIKKGTRMKSLKLETKRANGTLTIRGGIMRAINSATVSRSERRSRAKEGRRAVNKLFRTRERVDRYNAKHPSTPMAYDPHEWERWNSGGKGGSKK